MRFSPICVSGFAWIPFVATLACGVSPTDRQAASAKPTYELPVPTAPVDALGVAPTAVAALASASADPAKAHLAEASALPSAETNPSGDIGGPGLHSAPSDGRKIVPTVRVEAVKVGIRSRPYAAI